jgi:protocatechuate 3,4-dioxygenase beta subunit
MIRNSKPNQVSRRESVKAMLVPALALSSRFMCACTKSSQETSTLWDGSDTDPAHPDDTGEVDASMATRDARVPDSQGHDTSAPESEPAWASGGTRSMRGPFEDPFANVEAITACALYPSQEPGPCYAPSPGREDISDGLGGLPMRLSFLVVGADGCRPIAGARVDVWHAGLEGYYSTYPRGDICNPDGQASAKTKVFCRGTRSTDEHGRCDFSSVFPGWYASRTLHVHFTVWIDDREAVTSQLYFEDALTDEILAQGDYRARGRRDTTNREDEVFSSHGARPEQVLFSTSKRADGSLHAWKRLSVAASRAKRGRP